MKVDYVTDTSDWEDWQRDYVYGIILILPPDDKEACREVNRLRDSQVRPKSCLTS